MSLFMAAAGMVGVGIPTFTQVSIRYTSTQTVDLTPYKAAGATSLEVQCTGAGGYNGGNRYGGEGGSWSKRTISLSGVSSIDLSVAGLATSGDGGATSALVNGTTICLAWGGFAGGGHNTSANIGDVSYRGGLGFDRFAATWVTGDLFAPGGGAAGPNGPGGDAYEVTDGATYGYWFPGAGGGGDAGPGGQNYGGGGGNSAGGDGSGRPGCARLIIR